MTIYLRPMQENSSRVTRPD